MVRGYRRRFWQGSTDHRGVPGAPGRVVTMLAHDGAQCWGMAYRVPEPEREAVLAKLDFREKGGYQRLVLSLHGRDGEVFAEGLSYVATPDNDDYLGCAPLPAIAEQVRRSEGPSGRNIDYVLRLADALAEMSVEDGHVARLAALLRQD